MLLGLEFPGIDHIVKFKPLFTVGGQDFNKPSFIAFQAMVLTLILFFIAGSKRQLVPKGVQNLIESAVDFVEDGIVNQTMGHSGIGWMPYLTSVFFFVLFCNITEVIPAYQMPATARMAIPALLSILTWVLFIGAGVKHNGPGYFKTALFPPGVPPALYILVTPIEFISTFLVRPFSLAVRLFANELAGHILLVTFATLAHAMFTAETSKALLMPMGILPFVMFIVFTAFELGVAFLQAYIFTILTAVFIGGATHPEH